MSWMKPFSRLSEKQQHVLSDINRNIKETHWIQGYAGTGKTLLLVHAIEKLVDSSPAATICFITFTHSLKDLVASGLSPRVSTRVSVMTHKLFISEKKKFDFVFLDEVQDISVEDLKRIKALSGTVQVAGDPEQSLYKEGARELDITGLLTPKKHGLFEIFRLSKLIREVAVAILPKSRLVEGQPKASDADVSIKLLKFDDEETEAAWVFEEARFDAKGDFKASAILFSTHDAIMKFSARVAKHLQLPAPPKWETVQPAKRRDSKISVKDYTEFNEFWKRHGIPLMYFGNGNGSLDDSKFKPMVYLMTYHSSKGLDFKSVYLPAANEDLYLFPEASDPDAERRLLFVAVTRSRQDLYISYTSNRPRDLLQGLPKGVVVEASPRIRVNEDSEELF